MDEILSAIHLANERLLALIDNKKMIDGSLIVTAIEGENKVYLEGLVTKEIYRVFVQIFDEVIEGIPQLKSDNYEKTISSSTASFQFVFFEKTDTARYRAKNEIKKAQMAEPQVTNDLIKITQKQGSRLEGLDFRLKTQESLERKISKEPHSKMRDVLRYTEISNVDSQYSDYCHTMEALEEKGYQISAVKNSWNDPFRAYKGINTNIKTPEGYEFELQFHTKESFDLKNGKLHELYEKQRVLDKEKDIDEWQRLEDEMFELSAKLEYPSQVERIGV